MRGSFLQKHLLANKRRIIYRVNEVDLGSWYYVTRNNQTCHHLPVPAKCEIWIWLHCYTLFLVDTEVRELYLIMSWVCTQQNSEYKKLYRINNPVVSANGFQGEKKKLQIIRRQRIKLKLWILDLNSKL